MVFGSRDRPAQGRSLFLGDFYKLLCEWFMILSLRIFLFFSKEHSELCDWEKDKKIPKRNIKHAKVLIFIVKIYLNGEFIEVPFIYRKFCCRSTDWQFIKTHHYILFIFNFQLSIQLRRNNYILFIFIGVIGTSLH